MYPRLAGESLKNAVIALRKAAAAAPTLPQQSEQVSYSDTRKENSVNYNRYHGSNHRSSDDYSGNYNSRDRFELGRGSWKQSWASGSY